MFENLIKSKVNIKKEANLLVIEYKKWSFKLPIYLIIFYILHTWLGCKMREIEISTITLYLYNLPFLLIFIVVALAVCSKEILIINNNELVIEKYNYSLDERYNYILNKILDEEKLFISEKDNNFIINGDSEAIKDLEISKDINFEEIDFYVFYVNYLSKKEYENKKVLVGYNGIDGKEVTMSKFKKDINEIRDSRSTFKN